MTQKQAIQLFEERKVRTVWDDETEKWYFAIVDVVAILTESADAAAYWRNSCKGNAEKPENRHRVARTERF